ncbi:MAG: hypothetical protein M1541_02660 [Acidobacteria bacterium]|nr:hypothetical protein [Acidobacteriota bacterium]
MAQTKIHPALRLLPSLTDAAFILPIAFIFCRLNGAKTMLADCDTGWHIRAGEWILANGRVPSTDMFSFTMPGAPWYAWEWLWEALFAWINRHAGMAGVVLASVAIISLTFALLFRLVRRKSGNVLIAFVVTMLAMGASSLHWLARPHLFTFLFLVIFYALLERAKDAGDSGRRLLWLLPAITVLWTNLHGGFFTGILLIGTYAAGEFTTWVVSGDAEERRAALARGARYLATTFGCFLASFINPYSYKLHSHIIEFLRDPYQYEHISEFLSLNFHHPLGVVFEIVIVLGVVAAMRT